MSKDPDPTIIADAARHRAIALARRVALQHCQMPGRPGYLPATAQQAEGWQPHEWVVDAIVAAFNEQRTFIEQSEIAAKLENAVAERQTQLEAGGQWRPVGDGAFAPPFGTIRVCRSCGCLVAGGPTACGRCANDPVGR